MLNNVERIAKVAYKKWMLEARKVFTSHPDQEVFACFFDGKLKGAKRIKFMEHLMRCEDCSNFVREQARMMYEEKSPPLELVERAKSLVSGKNSVALAELVLRFKERLIEVVNATNGILIGQDFLPAPALRAQKKDGFQDSVLIYKDFQNTRVELKIENSGGGYFTLIVMMKEISTQKVIKDLRVSLIREGSELESYLADSGKAVFEHVLLGKYLVEIRNVESKLASVLIDINV